MKKVLLSLTIILFAVHCMAQEQLAFPFKGGKEIMSQFFKDSLAVTPEIVQARATGVVVFKFTADTKGNISKMIVFYADDAVLVTPVIEALKTSNHKWVIPNHEKTHDFIIPFTFNFGRPAAESAALQNSVYNFNRNRHPIFNQDQVPLNMATLLPAIMVSYDVGQ